MTQIKHDTYVHFWQDEDFPSVLLYSRRSIIRTLALPDLGIDDRTVQIIKL